MTQVISIGPPFAMTTNGLIYAMPARMVWVTASRVCEFANTTTTTDFTRVTASTTGFQSSYAFVRCTDVTTATISLKA